MYIKSNQTKLPIIYPQNNTYLNNKKYILHILEPEPLGEIGGADTHVISLCQAQLKKSKYNPVVLINQNRDYAYMLKNAQIAYIDGTQLKSKKLGLIHYAKYVPQILNIHCIHSHQYDANYITYLLNKFYKKTWGRIPIVMTCHGWVRTSIKNKIKTELDFYTYSIANILIAVSKKDCNYLKEHINNKSIYYIPNGVYNKSDTPTNNKDYYKQIFNLPVKTAIIAYIGRLASEKRIDIYLRACQEIYQQNENVIFLVVGSGEEEKKLKKLATSLGIGKHTYFLGIIKKIEYIYIIADIVILSSDTETTSRTVLEAMSFGKSVIATNVGGLPDIICSYKNGILVPKGNYAKIADAAISLLNNANLSQRIGIKAAETIKQKFTIDIMRDAIEEVYDKL